MTYTASIDIMPLKELLDPQGKAVEAGLKNMSLYNISQVRIGKHISIQIDASSEVEAKEVIQNACEKLLVNKIMESYTFTLEKQ